MKAVLAAVVAPVAWHGATVAGLVRPFAAVLAVVGSAWLVRDRRAGKDGG